MHPKTVWFVNVNKSKKSEFSFNLINNKEHEDEPVLGLSTKLYISRAPPSYYGRNLLFLSKK